MPGLIVKAAAALEARKPLPEGEYHAILTDHKTTQARGQKPGQISLEFTIHDSEGEPFAGKTCFRNLFATEKAAAFMIDAAIALGADEEEVTAEEVDFDAVFQQLHGNECWLQTSINSYTPEGRTQTVERTNVDRILSERS